jgi:tetratricopeptide (TPR) repeat protein
MKKIALTICFLLPFLLSASSRRQEPLANAGKPGLNAKSIDQVLRLKDNEVDLATAALIASENWSTVVYGRRYLATLDNMAIEIRNRLTQKRLPANYRAIPVINEYLFGELGYESLSEANDPNGLFLHIVMDKKRGYCLSLSMLYLCLGERLGLDLYGVVVPGHFFVRYDDGRTKFNIETTSKGGVVTDEQYIKKFNVPRGSDSGLYMKNLNKIQTIGCFFNNLGNSYSAIGDTVTAQQVLKKSVEINPALAEAHANLGNIYLKNNQITDAVYEYQAALIVNPNDAKTHNNIGNAYSEQEKLTLALGEYQQAMRLDPNYTDAYRNLAIVYVKQKQYFLAVTAVKQAIALSPKDADCYNQLGDVYRRMDDYVQAVAQYTKAIELKADFVEAYHGLAIAYQSLKQTDDEIQTYQKVLRIKSDDYVALANLGQVFFEQGKFAQAIEVYQKAASVQPKKAIIHYNLGAAYSNNKNYEQAVTEYLAAIELDPKMGDAHLGLAISYYYLKKYDLAMKHVASAQEMGVTVEQDKIDAIKSHL